MLTWLHTDGRYIKNSYGKLVNLRGATVYRPNDCAFGESPYWGEYWGENSINNSFGLLKSSGANFVRLSINPAAYMGLEHDFNCIGTDPIDVEAYKVNMDLLINELAKRDIYCYIDIHAFFGNARGPSYWAYFVDNIKDQFVLALQDMAERYKNQPGMIGMGINEPRYFYDLYPYNGYWWDFMLECATAIHAVNSKLIWFCPSTSRIVGGEIIPGNMSDGGYKVVGDQFVLNPLPEPNIVYSFHNHFPMDSTNPLWVNYAIGNNELARQQFEEFLYKIAFRASIEYDLPVANVEFNVKHYNYTTGEVLPYDSYVVTNDLLDLMNKYGCSWNWWTWRASVGYPWDHSPDSNDLVYMSDPVSTKWDKLSYHGEIWKDYLVTPIEKAYNYLDVIIPSVFGAVIFKIIEKK